MKATVFRNVPVRVPQRNRSSGALFTYTQNREEYVYVCERIYFKELAHMTVEVGKSRIHRARQQAADSGRS